MADQLVANAIHDFTLDFLSLQRSIGRLGGGLAENADLATELEVYLVK